MSVGKTATVRAEISPEAQEQAEAILHELGLSASGAIELRYRQVVLNRGLPFDVRPSHRETLAALEEAGQKNGTPFHSTEPIFEDLGNCRLFRAA